MEGAVAFFREFLRGIESFVHGGPKHILHQGHIGMKR